MAAVKNNLFIFPLFFSGKITKKMYYYKINY